MRYRIAYRLSGSITVLFITATAVQLGPQITDLVADGLIIVGVTLL